MSAPQPSEASRSLPARFHPCATCGTSVLMAYRTEADPIGRPAEHDCDARLEAVEVLAAVLHPHTCTAMFTHYGPAKKCEQVARAVLASDWLAARDAEHEREVAVCSQCGERASTMVKIGTLDGWCTACLDEAAEPTEALAAAERALADLRREIKALADEWEADFLAYRHEDPAHLRIRALLPRDDAAGAGGAS